MSKRLETAIANARKEGFLVRTKANLEARDAWCLICDEMKVPVIEFITCAGNHAVIAIDGFQSVKMSLWDAQELAITLSVCLGAKPPLQVSTEYGPPFVDSQKI